MARRTREGRANQRLRTRKAILQAAARLLKEGRTPSFEDVAAEALVSRATAYRYFSGIDALLAETVVDVAVPEASELFANERSKDPKARLERVDAVLQKAIIENEAPLRLMLANSLQQAIRDPGARPVPVRQNRRTPLIEAALEPALKDLRRADLAKLRAALALVLGTEAMVVFRDVLRMDPQEAARVKRWAIGALVDAATR